MQKRKVLFVIIILIVVIISATMLFIVLSNDTPKYKSESITNEPESVVAAFYETTTQNQTFNNENVLSSQASENVSNGTKEKLDKTIKAPEDFVRLLSICGKTVDQVFETGCRQMITVESTGSAAQINFYRFSDNIWTYDSDLSCSGFVGANGITENMHEGNYATPKGIFR